MGWVMLGSVEVIWGYLVRSWGYLGQCQGQSLSRLAPVERKRSTEKRRCHQTLKSHTLLKCQNRSRIAPVERKRSHDITQVQKSRSVPATTNGETNTKPYVFEDFRGSLIEIGGANFEAKRPRAGPL